MKRLDAVPRLGWVDQASPVTALPELARRLGASWLGVKRDDELAGLYGGSKLRKLDVALACPPCAEAKTWVSIGAIGSGHLAALTAAAQELDRKLIAHIFWEPISRGVLENLAFTASGPTQITYHRSPLTLALTAPKTLLARHIGDAVVIPPGATSTAGVVGFVRAGLELAAQIRAGEIPSPDRIYVALGSGGTVAGLALGLGIAGVRTTLHAVAAVDRIAASKLRLSFLIRAAARWLSRYGVDVRPSIAAPILINRSQLGAGYGIATAQSLAACEVIGRGGPSLEPIYTGKAFAALLADGDRRRLPANVLFWNTARNRPLPSADDWMDRLPPALAAAISSATRRPLGRRPLLLGGLAALGAAAAVRVTGYPTIPGWAGAVLSPSEAYVLAAVAEAICPPEGPAPLVVAANVDRFITSMPEPLRRQIHGLLSLLQHGTFLGLRLRRFTALSPAERFGVLESLTARGGVFGMAARGARDLCFLGYYQDESAWASIGYGGPWAAEATDSMALRYELMRAPALSLPKCAKGAGRGL